MFSDAPDSPAMPLQYDGALDGRQILGKEQLGSLYSSELCMASARVEMVPRDGKPTPHLDISFYAGSRNKLIVALGLPVHGESVTWPASFDAWPAAFLRDASSRVVREVAGKALHPRQLSFFSNPRVAAESSLEDLLRGRSCPGFENYWTVAQLLWRYRLAASLLGKGRVLELACGSGFGAGLLLKQSERVTSYLGLDPDPGAIAAANLLNLDPRARFVSAATAGLDQEQFDGVLSFETAARAPDPEAFLGVLKQRLKADGRLIMSLPCERWHGFHANRGHWSSWNLARIRKLVEPHFESVGYYRHERPHFTENAFATGQLAPLDPDEDRSGHEGYVLVLERPRHCEPRRRIVIRRRYARGDALQATPIIQALRNRHPDHLIVASTDVTEVFMNNPDVDLLMAASSGYRPGKDDRVVNLDEAYEKRPHLHILDAYSEETREPIHDPRLRLFPNRWDYEAARRLLEHKIGRWERIKYLIAVHLCTTPDRSWPAEHWIKFLNAIAPAADTAVLAVGAGSDMPVNDHDLVINCVNKADFLTTAALISLTDCLIGPDSSLLHVAAAVGTPAIGLYGMVFPELRVPYGAAQSAIRAPVECAGCLMSLPAPVTNPRCKFGKSFCMEAISPQMVLARLESLKSVLQERKWLRRYVMSGDR